MREEMVRVYPLPSLHLQDILLHPPLPLTHTHTLSGSAQTSKQSKTTETETARLEV